MVLCALMCMGAAEKSTPLPTCAPPRRARRPVPLERGWAAVFLRLPGGRLAAVGLFRRRQLEEVVDEPAEVARLAQALSRAPGALPALGGLRPPPRGW
jgi:hypothetical protein